MMNNYWTKYEIELLKNNYLTSTDDELSHIFGRTTTCIKSARYRFGFILPAHITKLRKSHRTPTETVYEATFIRDNYLLIPVKTMARMLNRSDCFVSGFIKRNKLIIPIELINKRKIASQYLPGRIPENKGKKMDPITYEKVSHTFFKKGRVPHNTKSDYEVTLRACGYYFIRISMGKWVELHRYIWELHYGTITPGNNIQFKDNNSNNCDIDNLYMVNRNQQAIINKQGGRKLPHELKQTILLINKLKNLTNEKQSNRSK